MPKGSGKRHGGGAAKKKERAVRAAYRRERKAGTYLTPGDPDFKSFSNQLAIQGLKLRDVPGDGNCLFRALSLQLKDRLSDHCQLRRDVVDYIRNHRDQFEPFIEDDTPFEEYVAELARDGEYAGNDAIVAFARLHSINVVIHQHNAARWEVLSPIKGCATVHIAYLNGEHYCSVESILPIDPLPIAHGPPLIRGEIQATPLSGACNGGGMSIEVKTVVEATGCKDLEVVEQSLCENSYDPQLAIVEVLQLMSLSESCGPDCSNGTRKSEPQNPLPEARLKQVHAMRSSQPQSGQRLSNKERKAEAKTARKQRKRDSKKTQLVKKPQEDPVG